MAAKRGDAYKALSEEEFATAEDLFTAEIKNVVVNVVDLYTGRARSRFGAMNYHGAIEDCNTALHFDNLNLIGLYYTGFSYLRLKRYNEAKEALTRCPRVEGMFNCDSLLLERDAAAAVEVEVASPVHPSEVELLMNISNAEPAQPPQPVENLWTKHYTKCLSITYVGAKLSLKRTLGKMLVAEAVSEVPGVHVGTKKLDIMLQLRDNEHDRQKSVLYMQDRKDCYILWKKQLNILKNNVAVETEVAFSHCWIMHDGVQIPLLKLQYNI